MTTTLINCQDQRTPAGPLASCRAQPSNAVYFTALAERCKKNLQKIFRGEAEGIAVNRPEMVRIGYVLSKKSAANKMGSGTKF